MESQQKITDIIAASVAVKQQLLADAQLVETIGRVAEAATTCFRNQGKVLFCGNGGSAADAQHIAAELSGRFYIDRDPLFAEALHVNTSYLTAVANDYSYDEIYSRMVRAKGRAGDVLIGISTSGNSGNVLKAIEVARELDMIVVGMTGSSGGAMKAQCDHLVNIPSNDTPRIQESHILVGHIICQLIEENLFGAKHGS
ncbi:MAG: D-sedoheptulose 7-phosphate isomerase [Bacteroidota bacterium]